jgi:hypothetical protein
VAVPVDVHAVDDVMPRRALVTGTDQVDFATRADRPGQDVVKVKFRPTSEGVVDIAPVDRQDPQDTASGLRATTPMVDMV